MKQANQCMSCGQMFIVQLGDPQLFCSKCNKQAKE